MLLLLLLLSFPNCCSEELIVGWLTIQVSIAWVVSSNNTVPSLAA
jgi:hypothetical protein